MEKYISIINTVAASSGDCVVSGNTVTMTGLKPFSALDLVSFKVNKCLFPVGMKYVATQALSTGDTFRFSVTQNVNNILETAYFSYVVTASDTVASIGTLISNWVTANKLEITSATSGANLAAFVLTLTGSTSNISFEVGGSLTTSAGLTSGVTFVYTAPATAVSGVTTASSTLGTLLEFSKTTHGLKNGQVVTLSGFDGNAAFLNGNTPCRINLISANKFSLSYMTGALVVCGATTAAATTGSVTLVASEEYGTAAYVNAQAAANGSTQTATDSTSYYSCVEVVGTYANTAMGNLVQPQAFIANMWYAEAATTGTTAPSSDVKTLEATLSALVK